MPTPLEPLERLSHHLGGPRIFVKRDDCTGLAGGGNKARKLEFLLADAMAQGADTIITVGGVQSNHARQTAAAAARMGLKCELVLPRVVDWHGDRYETSGNRLLDELLGAKLHIVDDEDAAAAKLGDIMTRILGEGGSAYFIPSGGSTPIGALGYVHAMAELSEQLRERKLGRVCHLVAAGSCGTQAGLAAGLEILGRDDRLLGISVYGKADSTAEKVGELARETVKLLGGKDAATASRVEVNDRYLGGGYGQPTAAMVEAVRLVARFEGLLLDPVYTGKAMAGLLDLVDQGSFSTRDQVIFWHTGGTPALFAYEELFQTPAR